jgi:hypothetical protein
MKYESGDSVGDQSPPQSVNYYYEWCLYTDRKFQQNYLQGTLIKKKIENS